MLIAKLNRLNLTSIGTKVDERGIIIVPDTNFPIRVSPALYGRTESVLKLFLNKLLGLEASVLSYRGSGYKEQMGVNWLGYNFSFHFEENSKRLLVPEDKRPKRGYDYPSDAWKLKPTGLLSLKVWGPGHGTISLRDGKRLIEDRLDEVIKKMFIQARKKQEKDRIEAIRIKRAIVHLQEKDKVRSEVEFQELRKKQLLIESRHWHRAEKLKEYVAAVEKTGYQSGQSFESETSWSEWITWAYNYIDSLNPISSGESGKTPPYPEPNEITGVPRVYLDYDDPEAEINKNRWELY